MTDTMQTVPSEAAGADSGAAVLMDILIGPARLQVLRAVAELNIADHLADGARTVEEVAAIEGSHPGACTG